MFADVPALEEALARCVAAGLAVRPVHQAARALRHRMQAEHCELTPEQLVHLAALEAEADRLSRAFVAAQGPLYAAAPVLFQRHLAEVNRRIEQRLGDAR